MRLAFIRTMYWAEDNLHFILVSAACIALLWMLLSHECPVCYEGCPCQWGLVK